MALPWVRMDTQWPQNPKFLMLIDDKKFRAVTAYWASVAWSGAQGLDGFVPFYALASIHATRREAGELMDVSLWIERDGGWAINDWAEYQPSSAEHEQRSKKARLAAESRWSRRDHHG